MPAVMEGHISQGNTPHLSTISMSDYHNSGFASENVIKHEANYIQTLMVQFWHLLALPHPKV